MANRGGSSPIEVARKALHRKNVEELAQGSVLAEAMELALQPPPETDPLERLSFITVLMRQLTAVVSQPEPPKAVIDLVHGVLGPALMPRGTLAVLLMAGLRNRIKPYPARSSEALTAVTRLAAALPPPNASSSSSHILQSLFQEVVREELSARPNLVAVATMLDVVSDAEIPDDLTTRLLSDITQVETGSIRSNALVNLLTRRRAQVSGSEDEKDQAMFLPLMPLFGQEDNSETVQILSRYLVPALLKDRTSAFPVLLDLLSDGDEYFASWMTVASYGVSSGLSVISGLPKDKLHEALVHEDDRLRVMAFELIALSKSVLDPHSLDLVRKSLKLNDAIPQSGARTEMASAIFAFLTHLKALEHNAARDVKRNKTPETVHKAEQDLAAASAFHVWFVNDYISPSIGDCRSNPPPRAMFGLKVLRVYTDIFGDKEQQMTSAYSPKMIELLIACQGSEFAETRVQAKNLIINGPTPLPGYETLSTPAVRKLLASARASINHPRNVQAEAGRSVLCILFTKLIQPSGQVEAVAFVTELVDLLEERLVKSEENLSTGIVEHPLHGLLSAITEVTRTLDLTSPAAQSDWAPLLHRLSSLVNRVWAQTSKVVSLGPAKEGDDTDTAAHEIARAYEVLGEGDEEGGEESLDHNNLLSACWRATKEAAELLAALLITPLSASPGQTVWSKGAVRQAGLTFLTWLHEIRYRGTFAKIATAFGHVVEVVKAAGMRDLIDEWLEHNLQVVADGQLSTLRRSAALPYSFLSLLSGDRDFLDKTVEKLLDMAKLDSGSSDATKVHAMNCLKIILLDAKQTRFLPRYFEGTVMVSLAAFGSSNWNVRNVGLILFSTLSHRSLGTARSQETAGTRAALAGRQTIAAWHKLYPSIIPQIADYLRKSYGQGPASLTEHSPLFPILIILRSLRWSPEGTRTAEYLYPVVERYLGSVEWQIREVASQALSSLLSPQRALEKAKVAATRVSHESDDHNLNHGRLLFLQRLFADVIIWSDVEDWDKTLLETRLRDALQAWVSCKAPVIPRAILDCINEYSLQTEPLDTELLSDAKRAANEFLHTPADYAPGLDLLQASSTDTVLRGADAKDVASLLSISVPEDAQIAALDRLEDAKLQSDETLNAVIALCRAKSSNSVRTRAFDVLSAWSRPEADREIASLTDLLSRTVQSTRSVPLREAALALLGRAIVGTEMDPQRLEWLASRVDVASTETKSEPSRVSVLRCLGHLSSVLFDSQLYTAVLRSTIVSLQRTLLRLLEDDDQDIRVGASSIVRKGLGLPRPVVQVEAVKLWWMWAAKDASREPTLWQEWLWATAIDKTFTMNDLATLRSASQSVEILFVEEPPNMFRNPLWDAHSAAYVLSTLPKTDSEGRTEAETLQLALSEGLASPPPSPIDEAWAVRWRLQQRADLLGIALA